MHLTNLSRNIQYYLSIAIYILINCLFTYKYGSRQELISPYILIAAYIISISVLIFIFYKTKQYLTDWSLKTSLIYWILISTLSCIFAYIIHKIDGNSLNVDRWSALELTVEGILKGQYPYTRLDHVNNMSSNFPALGFVAIPFYLLGDVGYLQICSFLLLAFYLFKRSTASTAFFILSLFLCSPAFLWEIAVKSDLATNLFLVALFIEWWIHKKQDNLFNNPFTLGVFIAFFILSRGIVIILLCFFFFKDFFKSQPKNICIFCITTLIVGCLICLPIVLSAPDVETLINYNPINLQTDKTPAFSYLFLIVPFIIPFVVENKSNYYFFTSIVILAITLTGFMSSIDEFGWHLTIFSHKYDLSYLSMALPSLLIWLNNDLSKNKSQILTDHS